MKDRTWLDSSTLQVEGHGAAARCGAGVFGPCRHVATWEPRPRPVASTPACALALPHALCVPCCYPPPTAATSRSRSATPTPACPSSSTACWGCRCATRTCCSPTSSPSWTPSSSRCAHNMRSAAHVTLPTLTPPCCMDSLIKQVRIHSPTTRHGMSLNPHSQSRYPHQHHLAAWTPSPSRCAHRAFRSRSWRSCVTSRSFLIAPSRSPSRRSHPPTTLWPQDPVLFTPRPLPALRFPSPSLPFDPHHPGLFC